MRELDCGTEEGLVVRAIMNGTETIEPLWERVAGRYLAEDVLHPETGEILAHRNDYMSDDEAKAIEAAGVKEVRIRSALTCRSRHGVCCMLRPQPRHWRCCRCW